MNIIFETQFGSHVYGTNTPNSDIDYKGIYQASYSDIILNKAKESIVYNPNKIKGEGVRNKAGDVDREYKELRRFIKDAINGQTYALDMLYVPEKFWVRKSDLWYELVNNRSRFLSKNMAAFIGYIRQQTGKYAMKGTRMSAVVDTVAALKKYPEKTKLSNIWEELPKGEFVYIKDHEVSVNYAKKTEKMLVVLEKMFAGNVPVSFPLEVLEKFEREFGTRSRAALLNQGIDWKAVSHAYRACYQMLDIAKNGRMIFPLKNAEYVLRVKNGEINYRDVVQSELPALMQESIDAIQNSSLPKAASSVFWDEFIINHYKNNI